MSPSIPLPSIETIWRHLINRGDCELQTMHFIVGTDFTVGTMHSVAASNFSDVNHERTVT